MKKPNFLNQFTIIDILIIICVIGAIGFAIFHMAADNSDDIASTSFDPSTNNKILEKYLDYYKDGNVIKTTVVGINSTNGEDVELEGDIIWIGEDDQSGINILLESNGEKVLTGLYKDIPNADIYYKQVSLETTGQKYSNLKEIKIQAMGANSFKELVSNIPNGTEYEISTDLAVSNLDVLKYQKLSNKLESNKRPSIILNPITKYISINRADETDMNMADSVFGNFEGQSSEITLRVYNCSDDTLKTIKDNYKVIKVVDIS